jgi:hypothetical protein
MVYIYYNFWLWIKHLEKPIDVDTIDTMFEWRVESLLWRRHLSGYMERNNFNTSMHPKLVQQVISTHPKQGLFNASQTLDRAPQSLQTQTNTTKVKQGIPPSSSRQTLEFQNKPISHQLSHPKISHLHHISYQ